jgi:transposase
MSVKDDRNRRWGLDGHDLRRLYAAAGRATDVRHLRRVQAVLLLAMGEGMDAICRVTTLSRQSLYNALHRYCRHRRPSDLADKPRCGRPPVAQAITDDHILLAKEVDPRAAGFNATTWTVPLLARYLSNLHAQTISPRTLRRRMHDLGLRWKRPRYVFHLKDPQAPQKKRALCGV